MSSLRRFTAFVSALFLLQLALLSGRPSCVSHASVMAYAPVEATQVAHESHDASHVAASTDTCIGEQATDSCASMPSCARSIGMPSSIVARAALPVPVASARPEPASARSHTAAGPDAPPPRG